MTDRTQRGRIRTPRKYPGEASIAPLIERGFVNVSAQGTTAQYVWLVEELTGPPELATAYAILVTGIPRYLDWHPILGVPVSNVRAELAKGSTTKAYVTVDYGLVVDGGGGWFDNDPSETAPAQIEVVSTVRGTTTNKDVSGAQILLEVEIPDPDGEAGATIWRPQPGEVAYEQPMHMVIFRRRENFSPGVVVPNGGRLASVDYIGHVNSNPFLGGTENMWLCTKMDGHSDDNGVTWNNTYEFQRKLPDWTTFVVARDPATRELVVLTPENAARSSKTVLIYPSANFNTLRLFG